MRFFGLKSCDTCRKALKALKEAGHDPQVIDVRADGLSDTDRTEIITQFGDASINKASTTWRGLSDAEKQADIPVLLAEHATLMKRPVIESDGTWTIGWAKPVQAQHLGD